MPPGTKDLFHRLIIAFSVGLVAAAICALFLLWLPSYWWDVIGIYQVSDRHAGWLAQDGKAMALVFLAGLALSFFGLAVHRIITRP